MRQEREEAAKKMEEQAKVLKEEHKQIIGPDLNPPLLGPETTPQVRWLEQKLHGPSMLAVKAKIYGVLYNQASSIAFDETSSNWSVLKSS